MRRALLELLVAATCIATAGALFTAFAGDASNPGAVAPHAMGVVGVALMLWAEVAHSLRRRNHGHARLPARWSLSAHVVAGLTGPALVLFHTRWQLHGLAGAVTVMTLLVVASGIVGRFFYPMVSLSQQSATRKTVAAWQLLHVPLATSTLALAAVHTVAAIYFGIGVR